MSAAPGRENPVSDGQEKTTPLEVEAPEFQYRMNLYAIKGGERMARPGFYPILESRFF